MAKPTVFISYSRKDTEFVRRIAGDLEQAGYDPWWDVADLRGGQAWAAEIEKHVRACDAAVVILSPDSNRSEWVGKETLLAIDLKKTIIPVMWRESALPLALVDRQFVDFRGNYADGLHGLLQALLSRSVPVSTAANAVSEVSMAVTQVGQDRQSAKRLFRVLAVVAAIMLLVGLAVAFRTPLSAQFGAAPGPAPKPTVPTATMVPSPSRRARVTVTFTQITVHDDADRWASGEIWLDFTVNGQSRRWPSSGFKDVDSGKTYDVNETFNVDLDETQTLTIFVNGTDKDSPPFDDDDPLGVVQRSYNSSAEWGRGSYDERSTCPVGCYTLHYQTEVNWLP
jgi:hypothetical protein